ATIPRRCPATFPATWTPSRPTGSATKAASHDVHRRADPHRSRTRHRRRQPWVARLALPRRQSPRQHLRHHHHPRSPRRIRHHPLRAVRRAHRTGHRRVGTRPPRGSGMTGPEHYREAEAILAEVHGNESTDQIMAVTSLAQVHATLALAAATALNNASGGLLRSDWNAWNDVAGTQVTP